MQCCHLLEVSPYNYFYSPDPSHNTVTPLGLAEIQTVNSLF